MKRKKFKVTIYYTGFCTYRVEAETKEESIRKARETKINNNEILSNLENWKEADDAEEIKKYASNSR